MDHTLPHADSSASEWRRHHVIEELEDDSGVALVTVMGIVLILFLLATMVLYITSYGTTSQQRQEAHVKSVHIADAGLNAYLYQLRRDSYYYQTNPVLGPSDQDDGHWIVTATPPSGSAPLTLRSEGCLDSEATTVAVVATVRFPTFADFMFLSNADINIGSGAMIQGKVRTNGNLDNRGTVTGDAFASGNITGGGTFGGGKYTRQPIVDFAQVSADMDSMRAAATAAGSYYAASGALGYRVSLGGATYTVEKVTAGTGTGNLVTTIVASNVAIPSCGVLYFADDVYTSGSYSCPVTIAGSRDIYITSNLGPEDSRSTATCGIVAQRNVVVPTWYPSVPNDMAVTAALLAQTGSVYGDVAHTPVKNSITIDGSSSYMTYGYFVSYVGNTVVGGFRNRTYIYDERLDAYPPPRYPVVHDGSLKVNTWVEG